jgi:hypothetical protein
MTGQDSTSLPLAAALADPPTRPPTDATEPVGMTVTTGYPTLLSEDP